ncbi:protein-methionine-sulfoxide reductase heme-binding subunit MsrQ [Shimia sp. R9_2]|uniref:protein-methionine-sulfoxide reductase heme-binding subunit MsrQ n=1 Tax=Shimia sp. R9_2 TaxID=2821112 RepID=UPI001ADA7307|nr:protein-methionine-sulfoxide reductase heme-binding subunit MsrQ [Shimia sp. R9_2]MBO9395046.1 protein-methionine-sulfoxide reductase heme-binding subunit MsrQ [Shimia sp. R9_2]
MTDALNTAIRKTPSWLLYLVGAAYPVWLLYAGFTGGLGVDPVKAMEHALGKAGLQVLVAVLLVSPLRRFTPLNFLSWRRALGVISFFYILLHFLVWMVLDVQILSQVWADIAKRPYIIVGMASLLILLPLAVTSNNRSVRKLGPKWRKLHKATYLAVLLGGIHYIMQIKSFQYEPYVYLFVIVGLIALRRLPKRQMRHPKKGPLRSAA